MLRRSPLRRGTASLKRTPIRRVSTKRAAQLREYSTRREAYLARNPVCEVWLRENNWRVAKIGPMGVVWYERATIQGIDVVEVNATILFQNWRAPVSTEIHHTNKRRGEMLNDEIHWLAVCHANHERIENNKAWARREGFLLNF